MNSKLIPKFNMFDGKRCFILGTGPSLNTTDFSLLKDEFTIGVNLILKSGFIPDYLCVSDGKLILENFNSIINHKMDNGVYVIVDDKRLSLGEIDNVYKLKSSTEFEYGIDKDFTQFKVSKPFSSFGGVLPDLAIPLADWLGFSEIYLLGCDGYHGGGDTEHFYNNTDGVVHRGVKLKINLTPAVNMLLVKGKRLYNCTPNSAHTEVPSIDLIDVIKGE